MNKTRPTHDKIVTRVSNFLSTELKRNEDISIFRNPDGTYDLFGKFSIKENDRGNYLVWANFGTGPIEFAVLKNAVSWCILQAQNKLDKANRIAYLDRLLSGIEASILRHKEMIKRNKNMESTLIYLAKLSEEQSQRKHLIRELTSHVNSSKYIQLQRFIKGRNKSPMINTR
jgi:hypothetical protein